MTLARSYKTNAIVLRARNLGEADKILTLLTDRSGKLDAVAKGIRRGKSHYGGRLEFGNECALTMHRGRSLDVIVSAEILRAPWEQLVEPERFAVATFAVELVDAFCEPDLAVPEIYALLRGMLAGVASGEHPHALVPRFSLRLLGELGLAPPMHDCVRCGVPLAAPAWLDAQDGGFVGIECREKWRELPEFDAGELDIVRALAAPRGAGASTLAPPRIAAAVDALVSHHLGRRPKSNAHLAEFA
ncbi:MAG: DNA repair protein RecO [Vulcanimicrobiaceae bacterium]